MQGRHFLIGIAISTLAPAVANAGEAVRRQACPKIDSQRQATPAQQTPPQRARSTECRTTKTVPPVFDQTPTFLL